MNEKGMTIQQKKILYSVLAGVGALLLIAAIVLTVVFATRKDDMAVDPPPVVTPDDDDKEPEEPEEPTDADVSFALPVAGAFSEYGAIYHNETLGTIYRHNAVDFAASEGEEVVCIAEGTVTEVSLSEELGNLVTVDHGEGLVSTYRFVEPKEGLKAGDKLAKGDVLGTVAAPYGTEAHGGAHLHFELTLNGESIDPADRLDLTLEEK